ncbi:hypothetical protein [Methanohalophilus sp.]|uniref:hypothetical protein n=1 Tax=Methanohalophilus sp. TaxID=1966352 RepID=UPI0026235E97|nr:hypothetical protein [Methanohalophilus sp.]MDK2892240.1 hypothetical protein [Methanohalophilus sp.]
MKINRIEKVLPCPSDPNKFRVIAYLDEKPEFALLYEKLKDKDGFVCSYSKKLDMLIISLKNVEMKFFSSG